MKKISLFIYLFIGMSTLVLNASEIDEMELPGMVRNYVKSNYPNAIDKKWDFNEKQKIYEVNFEENGRKVNLELSYTGLVLNGNEEMSLNDAPEFIDKYIDSNAGSKLVNVFKKVDSKGVKYDAYISYTNGDDVKYKNIIFNQKGKVIKK